LLLSVLAVILSEAKDPEASHPPIPLEPFNQQAQLLPVLSAREEQQKHPHLHKTKHIPPTHKKRCTQIDSPGFPQKNPRLRRLYLKNEYIHHQRR
jgi:hypothetical protein